MPDVVELAGGRQATFEVVGDGEPLLFFEGGPGLPASLSRLDGELLAERFATYLIDPHGSGGSTPPADPALYDHLGHATFYDEVRTALGIEKATVAGISFGGTVALTYAALFPETVVRCIAISAFGVGVDIDDGEVTAEQERMLSRHAGAPWYRDARAVMDGWTDRALATEDASEVAWMLGEVLRSTARSRTRPGHSPRRLTSALQMSTRPLSASSEGQTFHARRSEATVAERAVSRRLTTKA